jgi:hypothetical protein
MIFNLFLIKKELCAAKLQLFLELANYFFLNPLFLFLCFKKNIYLYFKTPNNMNIEKIKEWISLGNTDEALDNLFENSDLYINQKDDLIIIKANWSTAKKNYSSGLSSLKEYAQSQSAANVAMLTFLELIEAELKEPNVALGKVDRSKPLTLIPENLLKTFIGRDADLTEIAQKLQNGQRRLVLRSIGGIGKSAILQKFVQTYRKNYQCIVFLEVSNDKLNPQLAYYEAFTRHQDLLKYLQLDLPPTLSPQDAFLKVMSAFGAVAGNNHLLIIDNVSEVMMETLKFLPPSDRWTILASSRQDLDSLEQYNLLPLTNEAARQLFHAHYPTVIQEDAALDKILQFIDNHTLTIELLAKNAKQRDLSIPKLLALIERDGLNIAQKARVTALSTGKTQFTVEHLFDAFSIDLSKKMLTTLLFFSVLPATPIKFDEMKDFLNITTDEQDNFLFEKWSALVANGWLQKTAAGYMCPQVIKEVIRLKLKPDSINCQYLIDAFISKMTLDDAKGEHGFSKQIYFLAAESVLKHIQESSERIIALAEKACIIASHNGFYTKCLQYAQRVVAFYEPNLKKDLKNSEKIACMYQQIAGAYRNLAQNDIALNWYRKAIELLEPEVKTFSESVAKIYTEGTLIYTDIAKTKMLESVNSTDAHKKAEALKSAEATNAEAIKIQQKAIKIFLKLNKNHTYLALCYNNLANLTPEAQFDKRLEYYEKALNLQIQLTGKEHPDTASMYNNLALAALKANKTEVALKYSEQSVLTLEQIYPAGHPNLVAGYLNRARSLEIAKQFVGAQAAIQKAKAMAQRLLPETHPLRMRVEELYAKLNSLAQKKA